MAEKSFVKGIFGLFLLVSGIGFLLAALSYGIASIIFNYLHFNFNIFATISAIWGIIGIGLSWFGLKLFFKNENEVLRKSIGLLGIMLFLLGWVAVIGGIVTGGLSWIATLLLWSMGLAFVSYGFGIGVLGFFKRLMFAVKEAV